MKQTGILVLLLLPLYVFTQVLEGVLYADDENGKHPCLV